MAVRLLDDLIGEINEPLQSAYANGEFYNVAVLQPDKEGRTFPMARRGVKEGIQISPKDSRGLVFYHRELAPQEVKPLEGAKGKNSYQLVTYKMRLVAVGDRSNITSVSDAWNNSDIAKDVMALLGANSILTGRESVTVQGRVITDKLEVLQTEFAGHTEFERWTLDLIAFAIDYNIQQRQICFTDPQPSGLTRVTAFTLTQATFDALGTPNPNFYYLICDE